jgi:hypothetical protein
MHTRTRARILDQSMRCGIRSGVAVNLSSGGVQFTPQEWADIIFALKLAADMLQAKINAVRSPTIPTIEDIEAQRDRLSILGDKIQLEAIK